MHYPQIILIILFTIKVTYSIIKDGEAKNIDGTGVVIFTAIIMVLLYLGGFFG